MTETSARVVCDSIGEHSPRLTTFLTRYPRFVHDEHLRHRCFSFSVSSSRAIPVAKKLEEARSDELRAAPVFWGAEQKGMSPGGELSDTDWCDKISYYDLERSQHGMRGYTSKEVAQRLWKDAAVMAALSAEEMVGIGVHKSIINRLLDPFCHCNVLYTATEPGLLNFFGLRLDQAAEPTIRALAEAMWRAWNESIPQKLEPGQWHLPFVDDETHKAVHNACRFLGGNGERYSSVEVREKTIKVSVARCARLSYMSFDTGKRSTVEEDLALYERLVGSHLIHASPAEHQATPDKPRLWNKDILGWPEEQTRGLPFWDHPELHGNLPGWVQYRKTLPGEAVAPLPEGYAL